MHAHRCLLHCIEMFSGTGDGKTQRIRLFHLFLSYVRHQNIQLYFSFGIKVKFIFKNSHVCIICTAYPLVVVFLVLVFFLLIFPKHFFQSNDFSVSPYLAK